MYCVFRNILSVFSKKGSKSIRFFFGTEEVTLLFLLYLKQDLTYTIRIQPRIDLCKPDSSIDWWSPDSWLSQMRTSKAAEVFPPFHETRPKRPPNIWNLESNLNFTLESSINDVTVVREGNKDFVTTILRP